MNTGRFRVCCLWLADVIGILLSALATHVLVMAFLGFGHRAEGISRVVLVASGCLTALAAQPFRDLVRKGR